MRIGDKKGWNVNSSTMTRRVTLLYPSRVSDNQGGFTQTYIIQEIVWGDFRPARSTRTLLENELTFYQDAKVYIRYGVEITEEYQILIEGKTYTIHSINDVDNQHRFLEIIMNG